ncbi:MAG: 30S ribosomal protein S21 [Candidatus Pacebacteria bacterium]|nr:30S ribosomal protein S21 [Candidatus Paceibacterota bacterium]
MINVQVEKNPTEHTTSIIRRFTKRVQESGVLNRVRSLRYSARNESSYVRKKKTLKVLRRRDDIQKMIKLGKMPIKTR